ncbi:hypothetical protein RKE29_21945 [Streptomyces sp. B1866]|uniref:hypothetical protein n=1 Tax=Streptomyces sp. B1866 TaxID=3075431 RepID=UPI0028908A2F|nr:hypothetical protein [Streptomyces sp. B1866]MDT3399279.1 hypothetical protein [Streptomyces sp. B1866]
MIRRPSRRLLRLPLSRPPGAPATRRPRAAAAVALSLAGALTLAGCMTVHGERANIPSVRRAEAPKALQRFVDGYNRAYREGDPRLVAQVETGPLGAIGVADVTMDRATHPHGNPDFYPLKLTDVRYAIPRQVGWPKFFVADAASNRDGNRWLVVMTRERADQPWRAAYLSIVAPDQLPGFATDEDGWARAVPAGPASGLAVAPDRLSAAYTDFLMTGQGDTFAPGPSTTVARGNRDQYRRTRTFWTEYIDTPVRAPAYPPVALRTDDGQALVFFGSQHRQKQTMAQGVRPRPDERIRALMTGEATRAVTLTRMAESVARVPARDAADPHVVFLNRIEGVTAAKGE